MINKLLLSVYILAGVAAFGHFWNDSSSRWDLEGKITISMFIIPLNPLYWSTVAFEVDDD